MHHHSLPLGDPVLLPPPALFTHAHALALSFQNPSILPRSRQNYNHLRKGWTEGLARCESDSSRLFFAGLLLELNTVHAQPPYVLGPAVGNRKRWKPAGISNTKNDVMHETWLVFLLGRVSGARVQKKSCCNSQSFKDWAILLLEKRALLKFILVIVICQFKHLVTSCGATWAV